MNIKLSSVFLAAALAIVGCGKDNGSAPTETTMGADKKQSDGDQKPARSETIKIDGSSTVYPINEAVAEEFQKATKARVTVGKSGTGGGFKKFCRGEIVITGASRPVKPSERELCAKAGIEFIELPVAYDGIAIVVHKENDWIEHMTVAELKAMWAPESAKNGIKKWSQIRAGWPDKEFHLFGPGVDSGTYDYFTKAIVGKEHASRGDFTASEDDNVLVQGIATDKVALGFFGYAYYKENTERLKLIPIEDGKADNGDGPVAPTLETVANGTYQPLSRPVFIYVSKQAVQRPEVTRFVDFYLGEGRALVEEVGYIPLPEQAYKLVVERFKSGQTGTLFGDGGSKVGVTIEDLLKQGGA